MPTKTRSAREKTLLFQLEKAAREKSLKRFSADSYKWFMTKVKFIGASNARSQIMSDAADANMFVSPSNFEIGKMYTYIYDAKWKDKLPYWDAFPLIIMVGPAKGGFYGCNLHYLNPQYRAVIFDKLIGIVNNKRFDRNTKILLSYQLMKATSKLDLLRPCFKRYLYSQLQTPLVEVPANQWQAALFLPTQNFQKASSGKVWRDSLDSI